MADAVRQEPAPQGSGNLFTRMVEGYRAVMVELNKVTWPERDQVRQATIAITIFVLLLGLVIWLMDVALQGILVKLIPSLFTGR